MKLGKGYYEEMNKKSIGVILASTGASLWAFSGLSGELLFKKYNISEEWLLSTRTFFAGIIILFISKFIYKEKLLSIFNDKKNIIDLIIFGIFGMYLVQYTYFATISNSNLSFATIMQYTAPFFIFIYESIKYKKKPQISTVMFLFMTILGVYFISTKGDINILLTSYKALFLGILSAISLAIYSIQPRRILSNTSSLLVVGYGMLVGAFIANVIHPFWNTGIELNTNILLNVGNVVLTGTILSYLLYISSLKYISSSLAGLLTAFEPILATILSFIIFELQLTNIEILGFALVFVSIYFLEKKL